MTGKVKGVIFSLVLIFIAMLMMPLVVDGVQDVMTDAQVDTFAGCVVDNGSVADGTGTMTGSPVTLAPGVNTPTVTVEGTFVVTLPVGMTGTATSDGWVITGSPVALVAGANTITVEAGGAGTISITATGGGTTAVVLTQDLYRASSGSITSITSNGVPVCTPTYQGFVAGTDTLTIRGLGITSPQTVVVTYLYEANAAYNGVNSIVGLIPLLVVVGLILVALINGMWAIQGKL